MAVRNTGAPPKPTPIKATAAASPASTPRRGLSGLVAGCLGMVATAVSGVAVALLLAGLYARDFASNYLGPQMQAMGLGFLAAPPAAPDPVKTKEWYSCDAHFQRSALSLQTVEYTIHCTAKVPLKLEKMKVAVYSPMEAQMSGDIWGEAGTPIDSKELLAEPKALGDQESADFTGTLRADPLTGTVLDHNRKFVVTGVLSYPDETEKADDKEKYEFELRTSESALE